MCIRDRSGIEQAWSQLDDHTRYILSAKYVSPITVRRAKLQAYYGEDGKGDRKIEINELETVIEEARPNYNRAYGIHTLGSFTARDGDWQRHPGGGYAVMRGGKWVHRWQKGSGSEAIHEDVGDITIPELSTL